MLNKLKPKDRRQLKYKRRNRKNPLKRLSLILSYLGMHKKPQRIS